MRSFLSRICLLAAVALAPWPAQGQDCNPAQYGERLRARYLEQCWPKQADLAARVDKARKALEAADAKSRIPAARTVVEGLLASTPQLGDRLRLAIADLGRLDSLAHIDDDGGRKYESLQIDSWLPAESRRSPGENHLRAEKCMDKDEREARCAPVYATAVTLSDTVFVMRNTVSILRSSLRDELEATLIRRRDRWHSYLYDSQFQYWWELGLNRWIEEKCCDLEADARGNPTEWREPPRHRAIILHPDIGLMYTRDEAKGERAKVALVVQWFGYQWWSWDRNKVSDLRGVSLVSTVADNAEAHAVGFGIQAQYNEYGLAVTSHGGKAVFTLTLNLLDRISKLNETWAERLRRP